MLWASSESLSPLPSAALMRVRQATGADVPAIAALIEEQVRRGNLLPRPAVAIQQTIDDWLVAVQDGVLVGCVSLLPYTSGLVEIRSLAVHERTQGNGAGRALMEAALAEARRRNIPTLFALTRVVGFFHRFGFSVSDRALFPEKVWRDCRQCPLIDHCDETAMVLHLNKES